MIRAWPTFSRPADPADERRPDHPMDLAALRRWWPLAAVVGLLFLAALAATRSQPQLEQINPAAEPTAESAPLLPPAPVETVVGEQGSGGATATGLPGWVGTVALVVLGVAALVMVALVIWAIVRDQGRRRSRRAGRAPAAAGPRTARDHQPP